MSKVAAQTTGKCGKGHRRFPGYTPADIESLDALGPPGGDRGRALDALLQQQAREEARYRRLVVPESAFGTAGLELAHALREHGDGSGGGHRRRPRGAGPDG